MHNCGGTYRPSCFESPYKAALQADKSKPQNKRLRFIREYSFIRLPFLAVKKYNTSDPAAAAIYVMEREAKAFTPLRGKISGISGKLCLKAL